MTDPLQLARECGMCVRSVSNHEPRWWSIEANQHSLAALISRVRAEAMREAEQDVKRFAWYFSDKPKTDFLAAFMQGVREHWNMDQWRAAIDAAIAQQEQEGTK